MMARTLRLILITGLLLMSAWMLFQQKNALSPPDLNAATQADTRLRTYVMTQNIELLRNDLIELHKSTEEAKIRESSRNRTAFLGWSVVLGVSLGLVVVELFIRKRP